MNTSSFKTGMVRAGIIPLLLLMAGMCLMPLLSDAADHVAVSVRPEGGERCIAGGTCRITWDAEAVQGSVDISLWNADRAEWMPVATRVASAGVFDWVVAPALRGERFRIRVQSNTNPDQFQISKTFFYIVEAKAVVSGAGEASAGDRTVSVYPSPAADVAYIACSDTPVKVILRNSLGREVQAGCTIAGTTVSLDTRSLATGMYSAEIQFRNGTSLYRAFIVGQ